MLRISRREAQLVSSLADLEALLAAGWVIDPPVERKRVPDRPDGAWYLDVILWREGRVKLLTLRDEPAVNSLVSRQSAESPAGS